MKLIYTHPNYIVIQNLKNVFEEAGLSVVIENHFASGAVGEIAPISAWPELWLRKESQLSLAKDLLKSFLDDVTLEPWVCANCGEKNEGNFLQCWQCGKEIC